MMTKTGLEISSELNNFIDLSIQIYQDLLGYSIERTLLKIINPEQWISFCHRNGLNEDSCGIFLPRNQTAIIPKDNKLGIFHEYFGHGLYCERNLFGKRLVNLEKKLFGEEKEFFKNRKFTKEDLENFRRKNKTFNYLNNFKEENLGVYEGFAVFSEYFLSREFKLNRLFEKRHEKLNGDFGKYFDRVISFNKKFGDLATFYEFGIERKTELERIKKLLENLYKNDLNSIKLGILFGSRKSFSDIDLFIISDNIKPSYCDWLDVRAYNSKDTEEKIRLLDSRVTDPIIIGSLIFGDEKYLSELKEKVFAQPITEEAIKYNLKMAEYSRKRYLDSSLGRALQDKNLLSSKLYLTNALALKNGDKLLTSKGLIDYAQETFLQSEKFIEVKGGIK